jgi:fibronectin type 3 domain-containing protein
MWNKNLSAYDEKGVTVRFMRAPEGLECFANTKHGNVLRWQNNDKATAFFVYRRAEEGKWKAIGKTDKSIFADKKAHRDGRYFYTVKALNGKKVSQYYDGKSVKCLSLPVLKSISNGTSGITVNWQKVSSADGYYVYRKTSSTSWQRIATVKKGSTVKYTDKTAKTGTNYSYTVKAFDGKLNGSYNSKGINITRLTAPENLLATSTDEGMQITFNYVKGANSYRVFRQTEKGKWQRIATVYSGSKGVKSYIDSDVTMGEEYTYTVRAVNGYYSGFDTNGLYIKRS